MTEKIKNKVKDEINRMPTAAEILQEREQRIADTEKRREASELDRKLIKKRDVIKELKAAVNKERAITDYELEKLPGSFFDDVRTALAELEYTYFRKMEPVYIELYRLRRAKIILQADAAGINFKDSKVLNFLTNQEKKYFNHIAAASAELHDVLQGIKRPDTDPKR